MKKRDKNLGMGSSISRQPAQGCVEITPALLKWRTSCTMASAGVQQK
jgi:hypothetical protein